MSSLCHLKSGAILTSQQLFLPHLSPRVFANEVTIRNCNLFLSLYFLTILCLKKQVFQFYMASCTHQAPLAQLSLLHICCVFLLLWLNLPMFPSGPRYSAVERISLFSSFLLWKIFGTVQDSSRLTSITNSFASRREEAYGNICLVLVYTGVGLIDPFQIS